VSPFITDVECVLEGGKATRLTPTDFDAKDFKKQAEAFVSSDRSLGDWHEVAGNPSFGDLQILRMSRKCLS